MTSNLKEIKKQLKSFAKRVKDFKYTDSALIVFLLTGMIGIGGISFNLYSAEDEIKTQEHAINTSILQLQKDFKRARQENNRLLRTTNLELIQLMEQGDHVVKSPWSSWQYGINYVNNNWNGAYKGRGDKKEKYPYEGIFERSADPYERYVAPNSKNYKLLSKSRNPRSASSNNRQGLSGYGIASTRPAREPIVAFEVNAAINPRAFKAPTVIAPVATQPNLPQAINFRPVQPQIASPSTPFIPTISADAPGTGNGDDSWLDPVNGDVAPIAQQAITGGVMDVNATGDTFSIVTHDGTNFTGIQGVGHISTPNGVRDLNWSNLGPITGSLQYGQLAAMKLVGGHTININGTTINFTGDGQYTAVEYTGRRINTNRWLFHTDGHNDRGSSTWVLGNGTNINLTGKNLMMYTSQFHGYSSDHSTIGFVNDGATITSSGDNNKIWIGLREDAYNDTRFMYFHNKSGSINLNGAENIFSYIDIPLTRRNNKFFNK